jgi:hypothetical protein
MLNSSMPISTMVVITLESIMLISATTVLVVDTLTFTPTQTTDTAIMNTMVDMEIWYLATIIFNVNLILINPMVLYYYLHPHMNNGNIHKNNGSIHKSNNTMIQTMLALLCDQLAD